MMVSRPSFFVRMLLTIVLAGPALLIGAATALAQDPIENDEILLNIEEPRDGAIYHGVANLRGWAVAPLGIERIEAYLDGEYVFDIPQGGYRQDVEEHPEFGTYPDAAYAGFSMALNYGDYPAGPHTLTIRAIDEASAFIERTVGFEVIRFPDEYIDHQPDDPRVRLDPSSTDIEATGPSAFDITGIEIDNQLYDLSLRWRDQQQGFAIEEIRENSGSPEPEIIMERYRILGMDGGIVEDLQTGLQWMRCSLGQRWDNSSGTCLDSDINNLYSFNDASLAAVSLNDSGGYEGYTDWRVPSIDELSSLVYCSSAEPLEFPGVRGCLGSYDRPTILQAAFPGTPEFAFWSASQDPSLSGIALAIFFDDDGSSFGLPLNNFSRVRLVRAALIIP